MKTLKISEYRKFSDISFKFFHPDGWVIRCTDKLSHQGLYKVSSTLQLTKYHLKEIVSLRQKEISEVTVTLFHAFHLISEVGKKYES